jgi:two-component system phosphate regulon sensor histidine kinase PhoR
VALRLHSRIVALNVLALGILTVVLGYFLSDRLQTAFESEIELQLYRSATLAKELVRSRPASTDSTALAEEIAGLLGVRVTLIAPDGRVLGVSQVTPNDLARLENHSNRPEFIDARHGGRGTSIRHSATLGKSFLCRDLPR